MSSHQTVLSESQVALLRDMLASGSAGEKPRLKPGPRPRQRDERAADLIKQFLDDHGWGTRQLAHATGLVAKQRGKPELTVSRRTIDRILSDDEYGYVPLARAKAAIALVMGVPPWRIWGRDAMSLEDQRTHVLDVAA